MNPEELLEAGLNRLGLEWEQRQVEKLLSYMEELERWNKRVNLVKAEGRELIIKHMLDSLAGIPVFRECNTGASLLDIGSGAGFPAIPLALFLTEKTFTLCEKTGKKAIFLENTAFRLGLKQVTVIQSDYNRLQDVFDVITFRAFTRVSSALDHFLRLIRPGGYILAYKGTRVKAEEEQTEMTGSSCNVQTMIKKLTVPFLDDERHILVIKKI